MLIFAIENNITIGYNYTCNQRLYSGAARKEKQTRRKRGDIVMFRKKAKIFSITPDQLEILRFGILLVENECVNSYRMNGDEFSKLQDDEAVKLRRLFNQIAGAGCSSAIIKVQK